MTALSGLQPKWNRFSTGRYPGKQTTAYVHNFVLGLKIRHQDVFPIGHSGERDAHSAGDECVDVVWQVSVKMFSYVFTHAEGWVEDADVPAPGSVGEVREYMNDLFCGGETQIYTGWWCLGDSSDQKPGGKKAPNRFPVPHDRGCGALPMWLSPI